MNLLVLSASAYFFENNPPPWKRLGRVFGDLEPRDIYEIEISPHDAETVYVAITRYRKADDYSPYLLKTTDYGETWTRIDASFPASTSQLVLPPWPFLRLTPFTPSTASKRSSTSSGGPSTSNRTASCPCIRAIRFSGVSLASSLPSLMMMSALILDSVAASLLVACLMAGPIRVDRQGFMPPILPFTRLL